MSDNIPKLRDYMVSEKVGFLLEDPLDTLPEYYRPWQDIAKNIGSFIEARTVVEKVDGMPYLREFDSNWSEDEVTKRKERCLAYVFLTFIGSAYIWQQGGSDKTSKERVMPIPEQLAVPWHTISKDLGFKPVPCMASVALNNYQVVKEKDKPISIENLEVICTVPCARWFFLVTIQVEVDAVSGIQAILRGKRAVLDGDDDKLKEAIHGITDSIVKIKKTSQKMSKGLTGDEFYNKVRPFLAGYGPGTNIPKGIVFKGVSETPLEAIGGSAAQSSTIQCFDAALGITHNEKPQAYLDKVREYMPPEHRNFIKALWKEPSIRDYVKRSENEELKQRYKNAVETLLDFRKLHYGLVRSYILKPAGIISRSGAEVTASPSVDEAKEEEGTGGQRIVGKGNFLEDIEGTTEAAMNDV